MRGPLAVLLFLLAAAPAAADDPAARLAAGAEALAADELERAASEFEAARTAAPELAPAWLGLAEVRSRQGRLEEALSLARRAQELAPGLAQAHRATARVLAALGADQAALAALARAREIEPAHARSLLLSALLLRRGGRTDEALAALRGGLEAGADGPLVRREIVLLLLEAADPDGALAAAEAAVERFPDAAPTALALGLALAALPDRRAEAPAWLERALERGVEQPGRVQLELGSILLDAGRTAEARQALEAAVAALPDSPDAWYRLGRARQLAGDGEGAAEALARFRQLGDSADAADHAAKTYGAALNEAQSLAAANQLNDALARVRELLSASPGEPRALILEAKVLYSLGRRREALASLAAAREAAPANAEVRLLEGLFLHQLGSRAEAETALLAAVDLQPELGEAWERLGRLALERDRPGLAADRFARALAAGTDSAALRLFYADALERAGRSEESQRQMAEYRRLRAAPDGR